MSALLEFHNPRARLPTWSMSPESRWVLMAPTGWGKSVWLRQLSLLQDADMTSIKWRGIDVGTANAATYRGCWPYLSPVQPRTGATIEEHVRALLGLSAHRDHDVARFLVDLRDGLVELGLRRLDFSRRRLRDLSGGELQALSLVRTVLLEPEGVWLDEPTSAMDPDLCRRLEDWLHDRFRGAWIWVTHDPVQAARLVERGARRVPIAAPEERAQVPKAAMTRATFTRVREADTIS